MPSDAESPPPLRTVARAQPQREAQEKLMSTPADRPVEVSRMRTVGASAGHKRTVIPIPGREMQFPDGPPALLDCGERDWWVWRIPGRVWACLSLLWLPFKLFGWALEAAVNLCVLALVAAGWAWWTGKITDDQVSAVLGQLGARALGILAKSGVI